MTWLMDIFRIYLEEQLLIKHCLITYLNPKYNGYQCPLASMVYKFLDKKSSGAHTSGGAIKSRIMWNQQLAEFYTSQLLENLKNENYIHFLKTILGVLI